MTHQWASWRASAVILPRALHVSRFTRHRDKVHFLNRFRQVRLINEMLEDDATRSLSSGFVGSFFSSFIVFLSRRATRCKNQTSFKDFYPLRRMLQLSVLQTKWDLVFCQLPENNKKKIKKKQFLLDRRIISRLYMKLCSSSVTLKCFLLLRSQLNCFLLCLQASSCERTQRFKSFCLDRIAKIEIKCSLALLKTHTLEIG